jgi:hypothetical protein
MPIWLGTSRQAPTGDKFRTWHSIVAARLNVIRPAFKVRRRGTFRRSGWTSWTICSLLRCGRDVFRRACNTRIVLQPVYWAVKMISKNSGINSRIGNDRRSRKSAASHLFPAKATCEAARRVA